GSWAFRPQQESPRAGGSEDAKRSFIPVRALKEPAGPRRLGLSKAPSPTLTANTSDIGSRRGAVRLGQAASEAIVTIRGAPTGPDAVTGLLDRRRTYVASRGRGPPALDTAGPARPWHAPWRADPARVGKVSDSRCRLGKRWLSGARSRQLARPAHAERGCRRHGGEPGFVSSARSPCRRARARPVTLTTAGFAGHQSPFDAFWQPALRAWPIPAVTSA